jgi:hypothetical protein
MGVVKRSRLIILIVVIVLLAVPIALLLLFRSPPPPPVAPSALDISHGPAFDVRVEKPRGARPLFGIFPEKLERYLFGGNELKFDNTSPGATVIDGGSNRREFHADGWNLVLVTDGDGRVAAGTVIVFPILLAEKQRTLRCRPPEHPTESLTSTTRPGSNLTDGSFQVEITNCENAETGKPIQWPPAPLTVRGSFAGLPSGGSH